MSTEALRGAESLRGGDVENRPAKPAPWSRKVPGLRQKSVRIFPDLFMPEFAAAISGARKAAKGPRVSPRWRGPIVLGLVLASGLCIASIIGVLQGGKDSRDARKRHKADCRDVSDAISEWGKRFSVEASTLGSMMTRERAASTSKPNFLVPGALLQAVTLDRLACMATEFDQTPPSVLYMPTVLQEDRADFEVYVGEARGAAGPIEITDNFGGTYSTSFPVFSLVPAPPRPSYNPVSAAWTVGDPETAATIDQHYGVDAQEFYRRTLPPQLQTRFFEQRRLIAHPLYLDDGIPVADFAIIVLFDVLDVTCVSENCPDDEDASILGYATFSLHVSRWNTIFPANVGVKGAATGHVIKTVSGSYRKHAQVHEPFLDLDLECHYNAAVGVVTHYCLGGAASFLVAVLLFLLLRRLEAGASRDRRIVDDQRKGVARDAAAAAQRKDERIRYGFEVSEKTERYLNHELKNRIFVLRQSCTDQALLGQIDEITEVLSSKAVLMRLSTGRYKASWDAVDPTKLVDRRWQRFVAANSPFERVPTTAAAVNRPLRLDKVLFNICLDNMLSTPPASLLQPCKTSRHAYGPRSNAFKYGDPSRPPALSLNVEPRNEGGTRVRLSLELRNWAGPEHAALLQLGEEELNEIAHAEGRRAHEHAAELSSGDGFSMAAAAASALGGTVRLVLLSDGVVAKLELPDVAAVLPSAARGNAAVPAAPVELSWLKVAMADDSASFRKMFVRVAEKVTSRVPIVAGATRDSIDDFPKTVVEDDVDVLFLDFNFAPVHHTKTGVDICRECRELDAEAGNVPRLIFIVSANDSPEDAERYRAAGADGSLGKRLTPARLREVLENAVQTHPRFAAWRRGDAPVLAVAADARWCLKTIDTPPQSLKTIDTPPASLKINDTPPQSLKTNDTPPQILKTIDAPPPTPRWLGGDRSERLRRAHSAGNRTGTA